MSRPCQKILSKPPEEKTEVKTEVKQSEDAWSIHRSLITKLYTTEVKTLRQVREHLEQNYGFFATERAYKHKLSTWGLSKKEQGREVLAIGDPSFRHEIVKKQETSYFQVWQANLVVVDGRTPQINEISSLLHVIDMKLSSASDTQSDPSSSIDPTQSPLQPQPDHSMSFFVSEDFASNNLPVNEHITSISGYLLGRLRELLRESQHTSPILSISQTDNEIDQEQSLNEVEARFVECIMQQARLHYQQLFEVHRITVCDPTRTELDVAKTRSFAEDFYDSRQLDHLFVQNQQHSPSLKDLQESIQMIEWLLSSNHIGFLISLLDLVIQHEGVGNGNALFVLLQQILAEDRQDQNCDMHPLFLIALWFCTIPSGVSKSNIALAALRKLLVFFQDSIGYFHPVTVGLLQTLAKNLLHKRLHDEAILRFRQLIKALVVTPSNHGSMVCCALRSISEAYLHQRRHLKSLEALEAAFDRAAWTAQIVDQENYIQLFYHMAEFFHTMGQHQTAVKTVEYVVEVCRDTFGSDHVFTDRAKRRLKSLQSDDSTYRKHVK